MKGLPEKMGLPEEQIHVAALAKAEEVMNDLTDLPEVLLSKLQRQPIFILAEAYLDLRRRGSPLKGMPEEPDRCYTPCLSGMERVGIPPRVGMRIDKNGEYVRKDYCTLLRERLSAALEDNAGLRESNQNIMATHEKWLVINVHMERRAEAAEQKLSAALLDNQRVRTALERALEWVNVPMQASDAAGLRQRLHDAIHSLPDAPATTKDGEALTQGDSGASDKSVLVT